MGTGQSLKLGWLYILAVLSHCLHFFSTMTSPFSRLLQLPHWHRDTLDLLRHAQGRSFLQSFQNSLLAYWAPQSAISFAGMACRLTCSLRAPMISRDVRSFSLVTVLRIIVN